MIRLAWRQFRFEAAIALGALVVVAVVLGVTGPHLVHVYDTDPTQLTGTYQTLQDAVAGLLVVVPALLGLFLGAPLVARELETGTFRLAWTQSVSRSRWLVVKFGVVGVTASVVAGGFSLMAAWWANPIDIVKADRFSPSNFGMLGVVPFGYALFAFALGATTGLFFRRTLPAMATTLPAYVGARYAVTFWVRPHFETPARRSVPLPMLRRIGFNQPQPGHLMLHALAPPIRNAWILALSIVDKAGHSLTWQAVDRTCPFMLGLLKPSASHSEVISPTSTAPKGVGPPQCIARLSSIYHGVVSYQPANRYWPFQIYETALFVAVALVLGALSMWWVRRRLV